MANISLEPLSGFRDYNSPTKDWVTTRLRSIFQRFGYQALETPSLERQEILLGKMGDEAQKLLYLFDDNGGRKIGLRYDLTVPLARFVSNNYRDLPMPFKRYEIGTAWRAERAQKGRYRQFTQADVDIVGDNGSLSSEQELLEMVAMVQRELKLEGLVCYINDRALIKLIMDHLEIDQKVRGSLLVMLDKKDKLEAGELDAELKKLSLTPNQLKSVNAVFLQEGTASIGQIQELVGDDQSLENIDKLLSYGEKNGLKIKFAPYMVRGLDYYTGTIFECSVPDFPSSIVGGGRYDSLVEQLIGEKLPAVGISFGVDRITDYLESKPLGEEAIFLVNLPENSDDTAEWALRLRAKGVAVERFLDSSVMLGKQIKYAVKRGYQEILIPFEDEWKSGKIVRKNLETGAQVSISREKI